MARSQFGTVQRHEGGVLQDPSKGSRKVVTEDVGVATTYTQLEY